MACQGIVLCLQEISFTPLGPSSISSSSALLTQTTNTNNGYPPATCAVFTGLSGRNKTINCNVPLYGGLAGFQIVPRTDPLPAATLSIRRSADATGVSLLWPAGLGSVVLEKSSELQTWSPADSQPTTSSIEISITGEKQFFRLTRP